MKLLREFNSFQPEILGEHTLPSGKKVFKMRGILQRADTINQNGRIYTREILERELKNYQKLLVRREHLGHLTILTVVWWSFRLSVTILLRHGWMMLGLYMEK